MTEQELKKLKLQLLRLLKEKAFKRGEFVLSSGKISNYYLDARRVTLLPEGGYLVASIILEMLEGKKIDAIGGPTLGADPILGAIAALCHQKRIPLTTFIVRKVAKGHGTQRQIEGPELKKASRVIIVDDVATTGSSLIEAKEALERIGVEVEKAIVIVDRNEGAKENLAKAGIPLEPIFTIEDFGV